MKAERVRNNLMDAAAVRVPARAPSWVVPSVKTGLLVLDLALSFAAFSGAFVLRQSSEVFTHVNGAWHWTAAFAPYGALLVLVLPIRVLSLGYYDLYRLRGEFSFVEDAVKVFKATAIGSLLIVATAFLYRCGFE